MVSTEEFKRANQHGKLVQQKNPKAIAAKYDRRKNLVIINLSNGALFGFPPQYAEGLETAEPEQMNRIQISPSGLGLHFPKLDADLYLPALLKGTFGSKSWAASRLGAIGGSVKSDIKSMAVRENGKKGGRPAKDSASREKVS